MHSNKPTMTEEEIVIRFLQQNSDFLKEYLVTNSSSSFLKDVSHRIKTKSNNDDPVQSLRGGNTNKSQSRKNVDCQHEKGMDRSSLASTVSIHISEDTENSTTKGEDVDVSKNKPGFSIDDSNDDNFHEPPPSVVPRTARKSVTSDLFHQWLQNGSSKVDSAKLLDSHYSHSAGGTPFPSSPSGTFDPSSLAGKDLELLEQNDRLMDLILDISNELDINALCHKILLNVGHLTKADRCSLFLSRGPREKRYLEAKLFDVDIDTSK